MGENVKHLRRAAAAVAGAVLVALAPGTVTSTARAADTSGTVAKPAPQYFSSTGDTAQALRNVAEMNLIPSADTGWRAPSQPKLTDAKACPAARCKDYTLPRPAGVPVTSPKVRVLLPVGYATARRKRYPVVYLFNGALSPWHRWSRATRLTQMSRSMQAIFVMPEGGHKDNAGFFTDWKDGSFSWETWHTQHLVPWVDKKFRTIKGARVAVGASMGAQGALTYAARHPGLFRSVLSISGLLDTTTLVQNGTPLMGLPDDLLDQLNLKKPDLRRVWGDPVLDRSTWAAHNPVEQVSKLEGVSLFLASGTGFPHYDPNDVIHSGIIEQNLWNQHRYFFAALAAAGLPYEARIVQGQFHDWPYFHDAMAWGLPKAIAAARR